MPEIPEIVLDRGDDAVDIFLQAMQEGADERFATMCAMRQPPGSRNTDKAFCQGARRAFEGMPEMNRKKILAEAKKAGINVGSKVYKGGLGRPNDPAAWVSSADDVLDVCKARNLNCEGVINHKAVERDLKPKNVPLAEDIIKRHALRIMNEEPKTAAAVKRSPKAKQALRERIIATHGKQKR